jgi:hypothetical protein
MHLNSSRVEVLALIVDMRNEGGGDTGRYDAIGEQLGPEDAGHGGDGRADPGKRSGLFDLGDI